VKKHDAKELSRPLLVDRIPAGGSYERVTAEPKELEAIAARLGIPHVESLSALLKATPWREGIKITGTLDAELDQVSVISLETFRQKLKADFTRYFMPQDRSVPEDEEDIDAIDNGEIDMGEIVVETLALELDPYPRKPGEEFHNLEEGDEVPPASPFATLSKLKTPPN
jgi:uncharacterized metal-binding protein YceD (DUF177 family)